MGLLLLGWRCPHIFYPSPTFSFSVLIFLLSISASLFCQCWKVNIKGKTVTHWNLLCRMQIHRLLTLFSAIKLNLLMSSHFCWWWGKRNFVLLFQSNPFSVLIPFSLYIRQWVRNHQPSPFLSFFWERWWSFPNTMMVRWDGWSVQDVLCAPSGHCGWGIGFTLVSALASTHCSCLRSLW